MGGDTKVWANGERVLSCMGEQCPATLVTLNVCKGGWGRAGFVVALVMVVVEPPVEVVVALRVLSYLEH